MIMFDIFMKYIIFLLFILKINSMDNYLDIKKSEINNLRPDGGIIINDIFNSEQNLKGGVEDIDDDITLNNKNKFISHCLKYKLFYILGGVLLAGTGIGLYFLIKYLTRKTEEVPIIIPTDILDYSTDIQYSTYISTTIHKIIPTNIPIIPTTIPTTIPELECNDVSEFCNDNSTLNFLRNRLSCEMHKVYGIDYCFGNMKNKTNKMGFMINNDPNCVLTTNAVIYYSFIHYNYNSILDGISFNNITVTYNNISDLSYCFSYLDVETLNITGLNFENVDNIMNMFKMATVKNFVGFENKIFNNKIDFSYVFPYSKMGNYLNLSTWKISIKDIDRPFCDSGFETIDVSNFDTSSLTDMSYAFDSSKNIKNLKLLGWNTLNVSCKRFFDSDSKLERVEFETENNPSIKHELEEDFDFICENNGCHKKNQTNFLSNNQYNSLTHNNLSKNTNFTGSYSNNGVNYFFELSGKIYNITSNLVNDYIVNPFQRLLKMLK